MQPPVAIVGIGELGGVFARAFLKAGHPVYPIVRSMDLNSALDRIPDPALTLIAVGEKDLAGVLRRIAPVHRQAVGLLQNELLPDAWRSTGIEDPTVISVWFEKKKGKAVNALRESPVYGPRAALITPALEGLGLPCRQLADFGELLFELVVKNVFVYTINICGLKTGGNTGTLWETHNALARQVAADIIDLQEALTGTAYGRDELMRGVLAGIEGDPAHKCMGRSAPARLARFITMADQAGVAAPAVRALQAELAK